MSAGSIAIPGVVHGSGEGPQAEWICKTGPIVRSGRGNSAGVAVDPEDVADGVATMSRVDVTVTRLGIAIVFTQPSAATMRLHGISRKDGGIGMTDLITPGSGQIIMRCCYANLAADAPGIVAVTLSSLGPDLGSSAPKCRRV